MADRCCFNCLFLEHTNRIIGGYMYRCRYCRNEDDFEGTVDKEDFACKHFIYSGECEPYRNVFERVELSCKLNR